MAQNADLIKQAMFEELQKILNPDGEIRRQAEERLAQLKYTEGKWDCPEHGRNSAVILIGYRVWHLSGGDYD